MAYHLSLIFFDILNPPLLKNKRKYGGWTLMIWITQTGTQSPTFAFRCVCH